ncbi:putative disease resistance RPP13-like protein 1 [Vicia villosa]|uniref:putative disease resistance RPP13-like protein 1 n=1 Tax=Vicia villosa TaxID=3911 RepID=UPI00273AD10D|nr:putative disease resistance RPP13-like protein 1 [Vicia villosa]XP_058721601.1 putative disease resistance RPP13-like protein 1 [Vicia villosa]XP_058721602.1 putative disease resistance RPP13-like protein 1 [Vicia villosa]XP_058721604.1 putative disease resistance RPP13-like protein 1 [Vicia villosa]XP_058721605.1 putative disease resistance RPP13-like protein 1 [Vicia villosa]XP_058721606.1 putative disease resistance RPP13-like protein 1 [Vicia villosa]XP_058721607.1 putative disease res
MAAIVGGALLSASMEMLVKKVVSGEFLDLFRRTKLDVELLEKLEITLLSLQSVLYDAEDKQITNPAVKKWLEMLQDAVFQADELFDEFNTEALRCKAEGGQVLNKFSSYFKRFNKKINSKLQKLFGRLEHLRNQNLGLKEGVSSCVRNITPTSPFLGDESAIYGRDDDRKKLKEFLLSEDGCDSGNKIGVISIVGMGGLGKTTLANLLYNDRDVKEKFKLRGWSHIPKDFDLVNITKTILESVTSGTITDTDFVKLQAQLQQSLSNKKFLLVLDDIWYGNYVGWNKLSDIFNVGQEGSKIIITTRDERVVLPMQKLIYVHHLRSLETGDSWSLLARHAFVEINYQQHPNLEEVGRELAKKCGGLPLAAIALGAILRFMSPDRWSDVLKSSIWEHTSEDVKPSLLLSYHYLPVSLKGCFAYCAIFPKNSVLVKKTMVQLWIAEGLIPQPRNENRWEKVAEECFDNLVRRCLIHRRSIGDGEVCFEMHDLINDLAMAVSSPYCTILDTHKPDIRVRYLAYDRFEYNSDDKFEKLHGLKRLRTFLPMPLESFGYYENFVSSKLFSDLLSTMTQLHVLSLSNSLNFTKLPNSIGNLIYLRYLNLSYTKIKSLPSETCKLYNLQTLLLSYCYKLIEFPEDMGKLVKLRHLDIRCTKLKKLPRQMSKLENLQTLSNFIVSSVKDVGLKIEDLGKFPHLRGSLSISQLENVNDPSHPSQANLDLKREIDKLELGWSYTAPSNSQIQVLERLRPSTNLKSLTISGFGGDKLSNWVGDPLFVNMVCLKITGCKRISVLPSVGQLGNLKQLFFSKMESVKSVGTVFYGSGSSSFQPFTSLEILSFEDMPEWEEWKLIGGTSIEFPSLIRLSLNNCPKLKENIPGNLPKLESLSVEDCPKLEGMTPNNLPSLVDLRLSGCPLLMGSRHSITNPPSDVFSQLVICLNSLQKLTLTNIPSLTSFPIDGLPKTLRSLSIFFCENLEFFSHESFHNYSSLEDLHIFSSCNSMTSFTLGSLPVLKSLYISDCKHLKSISIAEDASEPNLVFLRSITIVECDELESVSLSRLPIPKLTDLCLTWCKKFRSLPESIKCLTSLQKMEIHNLPNLQSFSIDDLPITLRELTVDKVGGILWNTTWRHHPSLSMLSIWSNDFVKGLMRTQVPFLPANLVSLRIFWLEDIECLDGKWLQHLTSLHTLAIYEAPKLKSLPEKGDLPSSLKELHIIRCPLLEANLQRKKGKEWSKISHIPKIYLTNENHRMSITSRFWFHLGFKLK